MTERRQFRAIKGTRDILPPDSARWNWFEHTAREVFESYNFGEIRLPIFEQTDLFARSVGTDTDIVSKEMFTFPASQGFEKSAPNGEEQQPGELVSLRPEATASVARAYIEHNMQALPGNVKLYYMGPMFRRERPQKGATASSTKSAQKSSASPMHPRSTPKSSKCCSSFSNAWD